MKNKYYHWSIQSLKLILIDSINQYDKVIAMDWSMYPTDEVRDMFRDMLQDQQDLSDVIKYKMKK